MRDVDPKLQKAVLVTGASSGIGRKISERLASEGYFVYAGARQMDDLQALSAISNVHGVRLDVTKGQDIAAAVALIKEQGRGLYALINNAGVFSAGNVMDTKPEEFDLVMSVNVTAPFRVTQAFLPLLLAHKGRIVTVGSIVGLGGISGAVSYIMSKHAIEAFTDSLAEEMEPLGVWVSVIEPGTYKSSLMETAAHRGNIDLHYAQQQVAGLKEPDEVASATVQALSEVKPKRRYLVAPDENEAHWVIEHQITRLVQANEGQPYTYDRTTLIQLLDKALAGSRPRAK